MIKFELNDNEEKAAKEFYQKHKDCCSKLLGKPIYSTTGGGFSYIITPTGLGLCTIIRCNSCDEEKDITDSNNW